MQPTTEHTTATVPAGWVQEGPEQAHAQRITAAQREATIQMWVHICTQHLEEGGREA